MKLPDLSLDVRAEDIGRFDNNSEDLGIPKNLLMECAGMQIVEACIAHFNPESGKSIIIFCGTGNNGGDGFVAARHFASRGFHVKVYLCGNPSKIRTPEALLNWNILNRLIFSVKITIISDSSQFNQTMSQKIARDGGLIVDALLGTGVSGRIREPIASAINFINNCTLPVVSVDIPSGMNPNTGKIPDLAVKCDYRVTFHREKIGLSDSSNKVIRSIGIPPEAELLVGRGDLLGALKRKSKDAHKGQYGKLLVIGGSKDFTGAPTFAALAGIEFGLDLVIALVPQSIEDSIRSFSPNLIVRAGKSEVFTLDDLPLAKELSRWADAVVVGPGLGTDEQTIRFCQELILWLDAQKIPAVIDADGIKVFADLVHGKGFRVSNSATIITPHQGELAIILGEKPIQIRNTATAIDDFLEKIAPKLQKIGGIYVYKGVYDVIFNSFLQKEESRTANPDFMQIRINITGTPAMTVGGTGDVLAGLMGCFLAIKNDPFESAISAAYMNGKLGEQTEQQLGSRISATDLINEIRNFLKKFINSRI